LTKPIRNPQSKIALILALFEKKSKIFSRLLWDFPKNFALWGKRGFITYETGA